MLACSHAHPAEGVMKALIQAGCDVNIIGRNIIQSLKVIRTSLTKNI